MPPSLSLNQSVKVTKGKYRGKTGKVYFYRQEGDSGRITLLLADGSSIYVDKEDIDFKFECIFIDVMIEPEERTNWKQYIKEIEEGDYYS